MEITLIICVFLFMSGREFLRFIDAQASRKEYYEHNGFEGEPDPADYWKRSNN